MNRGLPAFNIVGMANKTINEAKDRVRSALVNSEFSFPDKKVTISLAPAELQKDGAYLDLPIALNVLVLSGQLLKSDVKERLFVGELSLDGTIRAVKGIINIVEVAKEAGFRELFVPKANLAQASLISGPTIYGVGTLQELFLFLKNQANLMIGDYKMQSRANNNVNAVLFDHILGQKLAKKIGRASCRERV